MNLKTNLTVLADENGSKITISNRIPFWIIVILHSLITFSNQYLLLSNEMYYNAFSEKMTLEQIQEIADQDGFVAWMVKGSSVILKSTGIANFVIAKRLCCMAPDLPKKA